MSLILQHLRRRYRGAAGEATDGQLLEGFALRHEESAFAALMARHGPMVLSVCRRVLPQTADVEDAFQATFLTLVRKAGSIRNQSSVAGWLCRVAYHAAIRTKTDAARRHAREQRAEDRPPVPPSAEAAWRELQEVLDEELVRLPEKYRAPLVLCYVEGKTHEEAAQHLGWPPGTVKGRLARARDLLRARLTRRGLGPVAGSIATVLAVNTPVHAVPAPLAASATRTVLLAAKGLAISPQVTALVNGLTRMLLLARLKTLAVVVLTGCLFGLAIVGGGLLAHDLWGTQPPGVPTPPVAGPIALPRPGPLVALDRFGDPLPRGALARMGTVRLRLGSPVYRFTYSRDGQTLAAGGDRTVFVWKADTGAEVRQLTGHENRVLGVAFGPDGRTLASSSADRTIRLWDLATGVELRRLEGHQATVGAVVFSPDGRSLVSGSADKTLRLWDLASGEEVRRLGDGTLPAVTWPVAFLPDNRTVATRDLKDALHFWDASTGQELRREWLPRQVSAVAFSGDGTAMAAARARSATIQLFEVATGRELRQFRGHRSAIDALAFSPDGKTLASSGADETIRFWEVTTAKELCQAATGQHHHSGLVFAPRGTTLAAGWDTMLRLWDTGSGRELFPLGHRGQVRLVAFLPDGRRLVSTGTDKTVRRWEIATGHEQSRWDGPAQDPAALAFAFTPDGKLMASGSKDRSIHLRDLATGQLVHQCRGHKDFVSGLAFAPDGRTLASASWDKTLALWDVSTGQELRRLHGHPNEVMAVAFAPDGKFVASGSTDGTLRIWDTATGKTLHQCGGDLGWVRGVSFSPDGKTVAAAGGVHGTRGKQGLLSLWEAATGQERARWEAHAERAYCVAFSPDGALLASGGGDHKVRLWEPATGRELPPLDGHRGAVVSVAFSRDGRHLASGSMDTTALVWPVTSRTVGSR